MKNTLLLFGLLFSVYISGQSIVQNPSFNSNQEPTWANQISKAPGWSVGCSYNYGNTGPFAATLFSETCSYFGTKLPVGNITNPITERLSKPANQRKIASIATRGNTGSENSDSYGNTLIGSFTTNLTAGESYSFCFWAWTNNQNEKIQIVLRKSGDCSGRRLVYTTPSFLLRNQWQSITGSFTVTQQDITNGYDKFEIRGFEPLPDPGGNGTIYLDDINILNSNFLGEDVSVCPGSNHQLDAGSLGNSYAWYLLPDLTTVLSGSQTYIPTQSGTYRVVVTDSDYGCDRSDDINVTFEDPSSCICSSSPTASFIFSNSTQTVQKNSKYGLIDVHVLCLSDELTVDGSASECENSYYVEIAEFDLQAWNNTNTLHSQWVTPLTQAPNNINISSFLPQGYQLRPGIVYKFKLAVGSPWQEESLWFTIDCCSSLNAQKSTKTSTKEKFTDQRKQ